MIFIVIPVFNRIKATVECLKSLELLEASDMHIILVDDGSTDNTSNIVASQFPYVEIIKGDGELFWTGAVRLGIDHAKKKSNPLDWLVLMNNDVVIKDRNLLPKLIAQSESYNRQALVAPLTLSSKDSSPVPSGTIVRSWFFNLTKHIFNNTDKNINLDKNVEIDLFTARFLLHPIEIFDNLNYRSDIFPHYAGDDDFSCQAKKSGFSLYVIPNLNVFLDTSREYTNVHKDKFLKRIYFHMFDKRSSINLKDRIYFGIYNASYFSKISYILISCFKTIVLSLIRSFSSKR